VKIIGLFFLACAAPMAVVAQQAAGAASQAPAAQSAPPAPAAVPAAKPATAVDPAKEAAIRNLFEVMGTKDAMRQVMASMSGSIRPLLESSLPPGEYRAQLIDLFFQRLQVKLRVDDLLELVIPVYDKYFSLEEIDGLAKFYQTPLGKKAISVLPQVLLESQTAGKKLGQEMGRQSMIEVLDEHPDLKKALEDAGAAQKN
jgi:uncharacterized protein